MEHIVSAATTTVTSTKASFVVVSHAVQLNMH